MSARTGPSRAGIAMLALVFVLWLAATAQANDFTVNDKGDTPDAALNDGVCADAAGHCTLRAAIDEANAESSDDTITVPAGRYDRDTSVSGTDEDDNANGDYDVVDNGSLTIKGATGDPTDVLISADGIERVIEVLDAANLTLSGVTIQDGLTWSTGGGADAESDSTLTLDNTRVVKNVSTGDEGGGIWANDGSTVTLNNGSAVENNNAYYSGGGIGHYGVLTLNDSSVDGNSAYYYYGGGIYSGSGSTLSINRSSVSNNDATDDDGGGIYYEGSNDVSIVDSHVDGNQTYYNGGAIVNYGGKLSVTRSTMNNNASNDDYGGAIYNGGDSVEVTDSDLSRNEAYYQGGAIYSYSGPVSVSGSTLNNNLSNDDDGGAIYNEGDGLTIDGSTLNENVAYDSGGAVDNESGNLSITNSTLNANQSNDEDGGAVYNDGWNVTIADSHLDSNAAYGSGGGVSNEGSDLSISRTTLDKNRAMWDSGGAVYNVGGHIGLDGVEADDNFAYDYGGSVYNEGGSVDVSNSHLDRNQTQYDAGGGIYNEGSDLTLTDSTVNDNKVADDSGGGISNDSGALTLTRVSVDRNTAQYGYGGGIYNDGNDTSITDSSVSQNKAEYDGGGFYDDSGDATIVNSTFADNQADMDTDGYYGGGIYNDAGTMSLTNVTVAGNLASDGTGGGIYNSGSGLELKNTIVADNQGVETDADHQDCDGSGFTSNGNNIDGKDGCGLDSSGSNGDQINTDPRLEKLGDYGGPTQTRALKDDSPAIDAADNSACPDKDQRGADRPPPAGSAGSTCDIGAYEAFAMADLAVGKSASPSPVTAGGNLTYTVTATNNGHDKANGVTLHDDLPGGVTFVSATPSQGTCSGTGPVDCSLGSIADGGSAQVQIVVRTASPGTLTNSASVDAALTDPDRSNNSSSVQTPVVAASQAQAQQQQQQQQLQQSPKKKTTLVVRGPKSVTLAQFLRGVTVQGFCRDGQCARWFRENAAVNVRRVRIAGYNLIVSRSFVPMNATATKVTLKPCARKGSAKQKPSCVARLKDQVKKFAPFKVKVVVVANTDDGQRLTGTLFFKVRR